MAKTVLLGAQGFQNVALFAQCDAIFCLRGTWPWRWRTA
jgi:hypothetical protein